MSTTCTDGGATCIELGKRACDSITDCWGFAVHMGWGVQIYDSKASNCDKCNGRYGLQESSDWTTYKKNSGNML